MEYRENKEDKYKCAYCGKEGLYKLEVENTKEILFYCRFHRLEMVNKIGSLLKKGYNFTAYNYSFYLEKEEDKTKNKKLEDYLKDGTS